MANVRMPERGCGDSVGIHVEIDPAVAIRKGSELNSGPGREKSIHSSKMKLLHQLNPEMAAAVMAADRTRVFAENNKRIYQTFKNQRQPRLSPYVSNHASRLRRSINSRLRRPIINSSSSTIDKPCLRLRPPAHPLSCMELLNPTSSDGDLDYDPSYNNNNRTTLPPMDFPNNVKHQRQRLNNRNFGLGLGLPFNYNSNPEYDTDLGNTLKAKANHYLKRDYNSDPNFKVHQNQTTTMKMNLPPLKLKDGTYARNTINNALNSSSGEPCKKFNKYPNNNENGTTATSKSPKFPNSSKWNSNSYYKLQPALVRNLKKLDFQDAHFSLPSISKDGKNYCYDYDANYDPWDSAGSGSGSDSCCFKKGDPRRRQHLKQQQIERLNLNSCSRQSERSRRKQVVDSGIATTTRRNYVRNYSDRNSGIGATALSTIVPRKNIFLQPLPPTTPSKTNCCNANGESSRNNRKNQHHYQCPTSPSSSQSRSANNLHDNLNWNKNIRACESKSASVIVKRNLYESIPHLLSPSLRARAAHPEDEPHPRYRSTVGQDDYDLQYVKNRLANLNKLKLPPISTPQNRNPNRNRNLIHGDETNHGTFENESYLQQKNKCARGFPSQERVPVCDAFLLRKLFELEMRERDRLQRQQRQFSARVINAGNSNQANESNNSDVDVDMENYDYELCNNNGYTNCDSGMARSQLLRSSYGSSKSYCDGDDLDPAREPSTYFNGPVRYVDRGQKDFILENAINSTRMPPKVPRPRVIDDCYGHSRVISQTRMTNNKDYGRVPEYLIRRKEELRLEKEEEELLWDEEEEAASEQSQCRVLSDVERKSLTDRLSCRWEQLFEEFQSFPMFSSSQRVIRRKSKIEDELRQLEESLRLLSRHGKLFVSNNSSSDADPTTPLLPSSYIQKTQFLWK